MVSRYTFLLIVASLAGLASAEWALAFSPAEYNSIALSPNGSVLIYPYTDGRFGDLADYGPFTSIASGIYDSARACALDSNGAVQCACASGADCSGIPTTTTVMDRLVQHPVQSGMWAGRVASDHSLVLWWTNQDGEPEAAPQMLNISAPNANWADAAIGSGVVCGVRAATGAIECWGGDAGGYLASYLLITIPNNYNFASVAVGNCHACAVRSNGTMYCWGLSANRRTRPPLPNTNWAAVSISGDNTCGLRSGGQIQCFGLDTAINAGPQNNYGFEAVSVDATDTTSSVACGVRADGSIECWGSSSDDLLPPDEEYVASLY